MNKAYVQQDLLAPSRLTQPETEAQLRVDQTHTNAAPRKEGEHSVEANVTEIIIAKSKTDSVQMLLPMLTKLNQEKRWLALIDPPKELLARWKSEMQSNLNEIMVLRSNNESCALDLCQKALALGTCHAAILWSNGISNETFEKFERASIAGNSHGIVVRTR